MDNIKIASIETDVMAKVLPIDTVDGIAGVDARALHGVLGVNKNFSQWFKYQIKAAHLIEGEDFIINTPIGIKSKGRPFIDYHLSCDAAKSLCMISKCINGRDTRRYFINAEKVGRALEARIAPPQALSKLQVLEMAIIIEKENVILIEENSNQKFIIEIQDQLIEDQKPSMEIINNICMAKNFLSATEMATILEMKSAQAFNKKMEAAGIIKRIANGQFRWVISAKYAELGLVKPNAYAQEVEGEEPRVRWSIRWTNRSVIWLNNNKELWNPTVVSDEDQLQVRLIG
jgi:phage anti-repressor protein